jgi:hypothetical protein
MKIFTKIDQKLKYLQLKKWGRGGTGSKTTIYLFLGLQKDVQATEEAVEDLI